MKFLFGNRIALETYDNKTSVSISSSMFNSPRNVVLPVQTEEKLGNRPRSLNVRKHVTKRSDNFPITTKLASSLKVTRNELTRGCDDK